MTEHRKGSALTAALAAAVIAAAALSGFAQAPEPARRVRFAQVSQDDLKTWLTYLASDALLGRQIYTEGYGLAAAYVADHLKSWGVKPLGKNGTYFQPVRVRGYKATTRNSSVTVTVKGVSKTFTHGTHVTFPANAAAPQKVVANRVDFIGYGRPDDYRGRDVKGALVVWIPPPSRSGAAAPAGRGRGTAATLVALGAPATVSFSPAPAPPTAAEEALSKAQAALDQARDAVVQARGQLQGRGGGAPAGRGTPAVADFTTVQRLDVPVPPQFTADETFFEFLFSGAPVPFDELKRLADKNEPLAPITLQDVTVAITVDHTYDLVSTQLTKNVVGMVEGTYSTLGKTHVVISAHLDHIGYRPSGGRGGGGGDCRRTQDGPGANPGGRTSTSEASPEGLVPLDQQDVISNGADDDGSGSVAVMAIAKAFATGPKPRRSVVFFWFAGEEAGLLGSRYDADHPLVPLESIQAVLNIDMVGRDDCDNTRGDYRNSVFVVGADRISTDLHNLLVDVNAGSPRPFTLDYELNDINDPENIYTRSDHYSYASKGIPIAFFTTGLHRDYHQVSDSVDKILFPKVTRIAQLVYETAFSLAYSSRALERDNRGPRSGKGFEGRLAK